MSTADGMVVRPPAGASLSRSPWVKLALWLCILVELGVASVFLEVPYYAIAPGTAEDVTPLIKGPADRVTDPKGDIRLTTVRIGPTRAFEAALYWLHPDVDVVPEKLILGTTKKEDHRKETLQEMDRSKETAIAIALRRLGHVVTETGTGGQVVLVVPGYPAEGKLQPGDTIHAVDGVPTTTAADAVAGIRKHQAGEVVRLDVERYESKARELVELTLVPSQDAPVRPVIGIDVRTRDQQLHYPFDVAIESGAIGGPSAGLAFTLAVIDVLSPGELTGGNSVAVTGTIEEDGTVGPIGGVGQKALAVRDAGVKYFLVPFDEAADAQKRVGRSVQVIGVRDLEDALDALGRLGGDLSALKAVTPTG